MQINGNKQLADLTQSEKFGKFKKDRKEKEKKIFFI